MTHETEMCPFCREYGLKKVLGYAFTYKGETIDIPDYVRYVCSHCNQDMEFGDDNVKSDEAIVDFMQKIDNNRACES